MIEDTNHPVPLHESFTLPVPDTGRKGRQYSKLNVCHNAYFGQYPELNSTSPCHWSPACTGGVLRTVSQDMVSMYTFSKQVSMYFLFPQPLFGLAAAGSPQDCQWGATSMALQEQISNRGKRPWHAFMTRGTSALTSRQGQCVVWVYTHWLYIVILYLADKGFGQKCSLAVRHNRGRSQISRQSTEQQKAPSPLTANLKNFGAAAVARIVKSREVQQNYYNICATLKFNHVWHTWRLRSIGKSHSSNWFNQGERLVVSPMTLYKATVVKAPGCGTHQC